MSTSTFGLKSKENNENDMTSVVWASTVFGPRLWPLSVRCHSLAAISDIRNTNTYMTLLFANF
jgi:hypothetical protein